MENETTTVPANRSMLQVLCVLSFINTSVFLLLYGIGFLSMGSVADMPYPEYEAMFNEKVAGLMDPDMAARSGELLKLIHEHGVALLGILFLRTVARFIGVLLMWRGRMRGFYIYGTAQLVGIFLPYAVLPWAYLGFFGPLMAVGMTALYGSQRRLLA